MATTYTLISSNVLTGSAASVTFSSIPSTYTDLVLRCSTRDTNNIADNGKLFIRFNSDTGTNYSWVFLVGNGSTSSSALGGNQTGYEAGNQSLDTSANTANTFSSSEIYIPNYLSTSSKPLSAIAVEEQNSATAYMALSSSLYRGSSAISSITITSTTLYATNSSFYLYGIKNS